jgi:acetyltransferase EpsM
MSHYWTNLMPARVLIVGAGNQGCIVADILLAAGDGGDLTPVGFIDDDPDRCDSLVLGVPVLGTQAQLRDVPHDAVVVAIGDNARRESVSLALEARGERLVTVRHPFSSIARDVTIGPGCMISSGVVVTPGARIGRGTLLNTSSSVDHQSILGAFAHVSVGATVGATVVIGARTLIGIGATVMTGCTVGADCLVGAGALVARNLPDNVVAAGVPARIRRQHI